MELGCANFLSRGCVHQPRSSPQPIVKGLLGRFQPMGRINCQLNLQLLSPPQQLEVGLKVLSFYSRFGLFGNKLPSWSYVGPTKSCLIRTKDVPITLITREILRVLETLVLGTRDKDQKYISYYIIISLMLSLFSCACWSVACIL